MAGMAATLTEKQDIEDIAAYFASQKKPLPANHAADAAKQHMAEQVASTASTTTTATDATAAQTIAQSDKGKELFEAYQCSTCHGKDGRGHVSAKVQLFPVIGGQHKDYIAKQLTEFRESARKNDHTTLMAPVAKKLKDDEIEELSNYISSME